MVAAYRCPTVTSDILLPSFEIIFISNTTSLSHHRSHFFLINFEKVINLLIDETTLGCNYRLELPGCVLKTQFHLLD